MPINPASNQPQQPVQRAHTRLNDVEYRLRQLEARRTGPLPYSPTIRFGTELVTVGAGFVPGAEAGFTITHNFGDVPDGVMAQTRPGGSMYNNVIIVGMYSTTATVASFVVHNFSTFDLSGGSLNVNWMAWKN